MRKEVLPVATQTKTAEEKLALLESLPVEFWEFVDLVKEHGPQLLRLLKVLIEKLGSHRPAGAQLFEGRHGMPEVADSWVDVHDGGRAHRYAIISGDPRPKSSTRSRR